ncbi:hypothetical protein ACFRMN_20120 [Streptomyces sp. NPDC056835]|uniref:hypothetical protein n=1 Tax=Streptomyces sp. NPDC056835 TaxID=3345956 RepID=UPI0036A59CF8
MNIRLWIDPTAVATLGFCFMCGRGHLAVVAVGEIASNDGPGHQALQIPLDACRPCEGRLLLLGADAQRSSVRPYVAAGHSH